MRIDDCIIGYENEKKVLKKMLDILSNSEKYKNIGVKVPRGLRLIGDPGLGKTLMAESLILDSGRYSVTVRKSEQSGELIKKIKSAFEEAMEHSPSIVFLDDLDKFSNDDSLGRNSDEFVTIQTCIDSIGDKDVFVIATINNSEYIPGSLFRPGRLERKMSVFNPSLSDTRKLVKHFLSEMQNVECDDIDAVASVFGRASVATIKYLINLAGIESSYNNKEKISCDDIVKTALEYFVNYHDDLTGEDDESLMRTAIHEAGHAFVAEFLDKGSVEYMCYKKEDDIIEGMVQTRSGESIASFDRLRHNAMIALAGKASTEICYGISEAGSESDMRAAYRSVSQIINEETFDDFSLYQKNGHQGLGEFKDSDVTLAVRKEMSRLYRLTYKIVFDNKAAIKCIAEGMFEKKYLLGDEIREIIDLEKGAK